MTVNDFGAVYERHVNCVVAGDMSAVLADMVTDNLSTVFDGVSVPQGKIYGCDIKSIRAEGDRGVGETVYDTENGAIGLRSIWEVHDGSWKATGLENFPP